MASAWWVKGKMAKNSATTYEADDYHLLREIISSFLFTIGLFSALSLLFFSTKTGLDVKGTMGVTGVFIANVLGSAFGLSSFIFPFAAFYAAVIVFKNRFSSHVINRIAALLLLLLSTTVLFGLMFWDKPVLGYEPAGGWLGAILATILRENVSGAVGSYIIATLLLLSSLIIVTNIGLSEVGGWVSRLASMALKAGGEAMSFTLHRLRSLSFASLDSVRKMVNVISLRMGSSRAAEQGNGAASMSLSHANPRINLYNVNGATGYDADEYEPEPVQGFEAQTKEAEVIDDFYHGSPLDAKRFQSSLRPLPDIVVEDNAAKSGTGSERGTCSVDINTDYTLPAIDLLDPKVETELDIDRRAIYDRAQLIEQKLADLGVKGEITQIRPGPVITMFEYKPAPGIKINKISGLTNDLAMGLSAISVRIVAPIPGKDVIGIEVPNDKREPLSLRELLEDPEFLKSRSKLTLALGKDISGHPHYTDLRKAPHLMIAGTTGSGKSVLLNALITSMLYKASPHELKFLMIDPKMLELSVYEGIPHLLHPVVTEPKAAAAALRWAVREMEERYKLLSLQGVRDIDGYNKRLCGLPKEEREAKWMPYIVLVLDELADLMIVSAREVGETITRLAQKARAAGIHLIVATQRPSVDVVAGLIKANFPARISFLVSSKVDSRVIMDSAGAEQLLGKGDMLFLQPGTFNLIRIQGAFISDGERERITDYLRNQAAPDYNQDITSVGEGGEGTGVDEDKDELYMKALEVISETRQVSISMLQRKLKIGYNRAARMVEIMECDGIVGPQETAGKPRDLLVDIDSVIERYHG